MAKAIVPNFLFNAEKVSDASHVVVFAARTHADDAFLTEILEKEDQDGRYANAEFKAGGDGARRTFLGIHRNQFKDEAEWLAKQVHINMGFAMFAAVALGIDAVPMEGADMAVLNQEFGLTEKGYTAVAVVSFGYRASDDFNAELPKSRLAEEVVFSKAWVGVGKVVWKLISDDVDLLITKDYVLNVCAVRLKLPSLMTWVKL